MKTLDEIYKEELTCETKSDWFMRWRKDWMTDDQWLCAIFLGRLFNGFHHVCAPIREWGKGICINTSHGNLATFDYDYLTKAVIMAHNWGVRFEVTGSAPGKVKIVLHKREKREGRMYERHPTIEQAIEKYKDL